MCDRRVQCGDITTVLTPLSPARYEGVGTQRGDPVPTTFKHLADAFRCTFLISFVFKSFSALFSPLVLRHVFAIANKNPTLLHIWIHFHVNSSSLFQNNAPCTFPSQAKRFLPGLAWARPRKLLPKMARELYPHC